MSPLCSVREKLGRRPSFQKNETTEMRCAREIAKTFSLRTQQTFFFTEIAATHTRSTTILNQNSLRKFLDAPKRSVCAVKTTVALSETALSLTSAANV